jgi:predicted lipid-binding transport protein (Tim44 family)
MQQGVMWIDIIIWAIIAVFLFKRFYDVLGTKEDLENPKNNTKTKKSSSGFKSTLKTGVIDKSAKVAPVTNERIYINKEKAKTLGQIDPDKIESIASALEKMPNFDLEKFLSGAEKAFETIIEAYSNSDIKTLEFLVSSSFLPTFKNKIEAQKETEMKKYIEVIKFNKVQIKEASKEKDKNIIKVFFDTEQLTLNKDKDGQIKDGSKQISKVTDIWTFAKNPNNKIWELIDIE